MSLKKGTFYVFVSNFINMLIALFTGFILPKMLSINTYADIRLFQLYVSYVGILHFGFSDGMYLKFGGKRINKLSKNDIKIEFNTFRNFQTIVTIICIFISLILKNKLLFFCTLTIFPINVANYIKYFYQATGEFKKYSWFTNVNTIFQFVINLLLIFIIKTDISSIYIVSYVISYFLYLIIVNREFRRTIDIKIFDLKIEFKILKENIKNGFFLMIGNFGNILFTSIDRIFVKYLFGIIEFAYYSFAVSIDHLLSVFITPISTVLYNYFCNKKNIQDILKIKKTIIVFAIILISLAFPAELVVELYIKQYINSLDVLFILFASNLLIIIVKCIHINLYKASKKQNRYFIIMLFTVILSIILNWISYLLVKTPIGIASATLLVSLIWFIIGEIDLKLYRLKFTEYMYIIISLAVFLLCAFFLTPIISFILYSIIIIILTRLFMVETFLFLKNEIYNCLKKIKRKKV